MALAACRHPAIEVDIPPNDTQTRQGFPYVVATDFFRKCTLFELQRSFTLSVRLKHGPKKTLSPSCFLPLDASASHQKLKAVSVDKVRQISDLIDCDSQLQSYKLKQLY